MRNLYAGLLQFNVFGLMLGSPLFVLYAFQSLLGFPRNIAYYVMLFFSILYVFICFSRKHKKIILAIFDELHEFQICCLLMFYVVTFSVAYEGVEEDQHVMLIAFTIALMFLFVGWMGFVLNSKSNKDDDIA